MIIMGKEMKRRERGEWGMRIEERRIMKRLKKCHR